MKPHLSFGIKTLSIVVSAVALAFLFNAVRTDSPFADRSQAPAPDQEAIIPDREISLVDAEALYRSGQAVFLDARDPDLYAEGHIDGAFSLPPFAFTREFPVVRHRLEQKTAVTYCDGELCELSHELADQLSAAGVVRVRVLKNGWTLWRTQGLPTAAGMEPLPDAAPTTAPETNAAAQPSLPGDAEMTNDHADSKTPAAPKPNAPNGSVDANSSEAP